ncbi:MAG: ATPase domain-containing protein, partial [Desulfurococcaceae archaeon]
MPLISFQETKEKLFRLMKNLGMDFSELEKQGLYSYVKIPVVKKPEDIIEFINKVIGDINPKIVVIDSISVLLESVKADDKRAWLQNYFYMLPEMINGLLILIAKIPVDKEKIDLGSIEFVADIVLIMKHRVELGLLSRVIEIRKARNSPLSIVEIPFRITRGKGIEVFILHIPMNLSKNFGHYEVRAPFFKDVIGVIPMDGVIAYIYSPDARIYTPLLFLADIILRYRLKIMVVSFIEHPYTLIKIAEDLGVVETKLDEEMIRDILSKHLIVVESINPYSATMNEIWMKLLSMINEHKPNILFIHGLESIYPILNKHAGTLFAVMFNALQFL